MVSNNYIKHITCCAAVHVTDEHMFWSYVYVLEVMNIFPIYIMHGHERSPAEVLGAAVLCCPPYTSSTAGSLSLQLYNNNYKLYNYVYR